MIDYVNEFFKRVLCLCQREAGTVYDPLATSGKPGLKAMTPRMLEKTLLARGYSRKLAKIAVAEAFASPAQSDLGATHGN